MAFLTMPQHSYTLPVPVQYEHGSWDYYYFFFHKKSEMLLYYNLEARHEISLGFKLRVTSSSKKNALDGSRGL